MSTETGCTELADWADRAGRASSRPRGRRREAGAVQAAAAPSFEGSEGGPKEGGLNVGRREGLNM